MPENVPPAFGPLLRNFRLAAGLSQEQLAERARVSTAAISALERGTRRSPQRQTLALIVAGLHLTDAELATLERSAARFRTRPTEPATEPVTDTWAKTFPVFLSSFVGREKEVGELAALIRENRLVTITGAGGGGKTRLACTTVQQIAQPPAGRILFADLAPSTEGAFFIPLLSSLVGAGVADSTDAIEAIAVQLRLAPALLVLDNCEHILDAVAPVVSRLLKNCPALRVVATSRERLGVSGEVVYRLAPLFIPKGDRTEELQAAPALRLFADRAVAVDPGFAIEEQNIIDVVDICRRLDGMPLAIELAVARLPMLGLRDLRKRLSQQFELAGTNRDVPDRHNTMQAAIAWSYDLLDPDERLLMDRVGIFAGGFTVEAAEIVCADDRLARPAVFRLLYRLVEKSLIQSSHGDAASRFTLLEPVRMYSLQQLSAADAFASMTRRHAQWITDVSDAFNLKDKTESNVRIFVVEVLAEIDNIRYALERLMASPVEEDIVLAARIVSGLRGVFLREGLYFEARRWSDQILGRLDDARYPALTSGVARLLFQSSVDSMEVAAADRAVAIFLRIGDLESLAMLYVHSSLRASERGDFERVNRLCDRCAALLESNPETKAMEGLFLRYRAVFHALQGRFDEARVDDDEANRLESSNLRPINHATRLGSRAEIEALAGNHTLALELSQKALLMIEGESRIQEITLHASMASYFVHLARFAEAGDAAQAALERAGELDDFAVRMALLVAAVCLARLGESHEAATILGYVDRPAVTAHRVWTPNESTILIALAEGLRQVLPIGDYDALIKAGQRTSLAKARELAFTCTS